MENIFQERISIRVYICIYIYICIKYTCLHIYSYIHIVNQVAAIIYIYIYIPEIVAIPINDKGICSKMGCMESLKIVIELSKNRPSQKGVCLKIGDIPKSGGIFFMSKTMRNHGIFVFRILGSKP